MSGFLKRLLGAQDRQQAAEDSSAFNTHIIQAAQVLQEKEDELEKRRGQLLSRIEAEQQNARNQLAHGNKLRALECLKKKKMLEQEVERIDTMVMRVMEQRATIESQASTLTVVSTLHQAALTAKENMQAANVEKVEQVTEDINETNEDMRQLHDAFAAPTATAAALDDDDLMQELDALDKEDEQELQAVHAPPAAQHAPAAAQHAPAAAQRERRAAQHVVPQAAKHSAAQVQGGKVQKPAAAAVKLVPARQPAAMAADAAVADELEGLREEMTA